MQAPCGMMKTNGKFSWIGVEVVFLATFAFWSFLPFIVAVLPGGVPCYIIAIIKLCPGF